MLKLEVLPLLFAVLTPTTAQHGQPTIGPFHSAVDDFGQAYYTDIGPFEDPTLQQIYPLGKYQTYLSSQSLPEIFGSVSTIIFVASNSGRYTAANPAMFILSSDPSVPDFPDTYYIVSNASWYCKGYGPNSNVSQADWPKFDNAGPLIVDALSGNPPAYQQWAKAVELSPNLSFIWGTIESIPLEANNLWAAGLEEDWPENPPRNAICIKSLA